MYDESLSRSSENFENHYFLLPLVEFMLVSFFDKNHLTLIDSVCFFLPNTDLSSSGDNVVKFVHVMSVRRILFPPFRWIPLQFGVETIL